jgi:O-antigen ligase
MLVQYFATSIFWVAIIVLAVFSTRLYFGLLLVVLIPLSAFSTFTGLQMEGTTFSVLGRSFLVVLIVATLLSIVRNPSHLPHGRPLYTLGAFLAWLIVKSIDTISFSESISALLEYLLVASVFLLAAIMVRKGNGRYVFGCIAFSALIPMLVGVLQVMMYYGWLPPAGFLMQNVSTLHIAGYSYAGIGSIYTHRNVFAHFLALSVIVFLLASGEELVDSRLRLPMVVASILMVFFVVLIATRGAIIILLMGTAFVALRRLRLSIVLFAVGTLIALFLFSDLIQFSLFRMTQAESQWSGRTEIWRIGLAHISPTGIGLSGIIVGKVIASDMGYMMAHNDYLKYLIETGVIGVALFIAFLFDVLGLGYQTWRSREKRQDVRAQAALVLVIWLCFGVAMIAENLQFLHYIILPFTVLGAFCGANETRKVSLP